ncbi:GIY-YIG nuclease family protein [Patescibacteria group bacterium]|nr:GIY-YIG nuclease family protein [Patescibacteria group bacterium]
MRQYFVYILANHKQGTLYTGVTNDLIVRVWQHKEKLDNKSFTSRYSINKLVYYEIYEDAYEAISREKQIKAGSRQKKIDLIEKYNKNWANLYNKL